MQKLCKFEALSRPKNQYKSHKDSPQNEQFFKEAGFTRNARIQYKFKEKILL